MKNNNSENKRFIVVKQEFEDQVKYSVFDNQVNKAVIMGLKTFEEALNLCEKYNKEIEEGYNE